MTFKKSLDWITGTKIAHRGLHDGNETVFENSMSAFARAVESGFAIECDLHLSKEGVPIVFHDDTVDRLTQGKGSVRSRTLAELAQIRLGGSADTIQPLSEHLQLVAGKVPVILELKGIEGADEGFVEAVMRDLENYSGDAALMSFDHWLVADMAKHCASRPFGLTAMGDDSSAAVHQQALKDFGFDFVSYSVNDLPCKFVSHVHDTLGMPVITWTVRDKASMEKTYQYADQITFEGFDPRA